jgi:hypothetical protein
MTKQANLVKIAQAEDTYDLLNHIAWTDVIRPQLQKQSDDFGKMLVAHLLGSPLPGTLTKEQLAGRIYGINEIISLMEKILTQGKKALETLNAEGLNL